MRVEVVICDRCGNRLAPGPITLVTVEAGDLRFKRDLCILCANDHRVWLSSEEDSQDENTSLERELSTRVREAEGQLAEVRESAVAAVERYAEGATADQLRDVIRDIASGARRRS